ncbi:MAG: hypothetical protein ACJAVQ_002159 [Nonlabens sp.]|jgi:hypothetical protein
MVWRSNWKLVKVLRDGEDRISSTDYGVWSMEYGVWINDI